MTAGNELHISNQSILDIFRAHYDEVKNTQKEWAKVRDALSSIRIDNPIRPYTLRRYILENHPDVYRTFCFADDETFGYTLHDIIRWVDVCSVDPSGHVVIRKTNEFSFLVNLARTEDFYQLSINFRELQVNLPIYLERCKAKESPAEKYLNLPEKKRSWFKVLSVD